MHMRELKSEGEIGVEDGAAPSRGGAGPAAGDRGPAQPLLMLDIDGVLSLFGFPPHRPPAGSFHAIEGVPHFLSAAAAPLLSRLSSVFELVWASGWEERANDHLPALLGLGRPLPFLTFERQAAAEGAAESEGAAETSAESQDAASGSMRAHWKLHAVDSYAGSRPLAWVDDAFNDACEHWAAARAFPTLLIATEPAVGLTADHAERLIAWANAAADPQAR
jgi:hypothetical protein